MASCVAKHKTVVACGYGRTFLLHHYDEDLFDALVGLWSRAPSQRLERDLKIMRAQSPIPPRLSSRLSRKPAVPVRHGNAGTHVCTVGLAPVS